MNEQTNEWMDECIGGFIIEWANRWNNDQVKWSWSCLDTVYL